MLDELWRCCGTTPGERKVGNRRISSVGCGDGDCVDEEGTFERLLAGVLGFGKTTTIKQAA